VVAMLATLPSARAETPVDGWIVWESNRNDGHRDLYLMKADGSGVTRLTTGGARVPTWAPDGRWIAYEDSVDTSAHVMRWDKSEEKHFPGTCKPLFWMHDNSGLVCNEGDSYNLIDPETGTQKLLFRFNDFPALVSTPGVYILAGGISADGRYLVAGTNLYVNGFAGANGSFTAGFAAAIFDLKAKDKIYFFGSGCGPSTAPTGDLVYHVCGEEAFCPTKPDIYHMSLAELASRSSYAPEMAHPDADWGHEYHPRVSTDGKWLVYAASTGCHADEFCDYEIHVHKLGAGNDARTRVTFDDKNDQYPHLYVGKLWQKASPQLKLVPSTLSFEVAPGGAAPAAQTVDVTNSASGTLAALSTSTTYRDGLAWVEVAASGEGNAQKLTVGVKPGGLAPGRHEATVQVVAQSAANSPQQLPVALVIRSAQQPDAGVSSGDGKAGSSGCSLVDSRRATPAPAWALLLVAAGLLLLRARGPRRRLP